MSSTGNSDSEIGRVATDNPVGAGIWRREARLNATTPHKDVRASVQFLRHVQQRYPVC